MRAVYILSIIYFLLIVPLFFTIHAIFDEKAKKCYYCISLLAISLHGGYITFKGKDIFIHYGINAKHFRVKEILKKIIKKQTFNFKLYKFTTAFLIPANRSGALFFGTAFFGLNQTLCPIVKAKNNNLKIKNHLAFTNDKYYRFVAEIGFFITLLDILLLAFIKLFRMLFYGKRD